MEVKELETDPSEVLGGNLKPPSDVDVPEALFRAYDVRGVVGDALTTGFAQLLGHAMGSRVLEEGGHVRVSVGSDDELKLDPEPAIRELEHLTDGE